MDDPLHALALRPKLEAIPTYILAMGNRVGVACLQLMTDNRPRFNVQCRTAHDVNSRVGEICFF